MIKNRVISLRVNSNLNREIEKLARSKQQTKSELVQNIIEEYFEKDKENIPRKRDKIIINRLIRLELFCRKNFEHNEDLTKGELAQINSATDDMLKHIY